MCGSASSITSSANGMSTTSGQTQRLVASATPVRTALPNPRRAPSCTTRTPGSSAGSASQASPVPSVLPLSTTMIS